MPKFILAEAVPRRSHTPIRWGEMFRQIKPGMAAVMELSDDDINRCRRALSASKMRGKYLDYYTYVEDGKLHVARDPLEDKTT